MDDEVDEALDGYAWDTECDCGHTRRQHSPQFALCRECGCVGFDPAPPAAAKEQP